MNTQPWAQPQALRGDAAQRFADLAEVLTSTTPSCHGDARFTADSLTSDTARSMSRVCGRCPVFGECSAFAETQSLKGRVQTFAGFWAGRAIGSTVLDEVAAS